MRPLAGQGAYLLFSIGLIATGLLGVPVLAGSAALAHHYFLVCNNPRVMGQHVNGKVMNALGVIAALVISVAALVMLIVWTRTWV